MNKSMKRSTITNNNWYKSMLAGNDFSHYELISTTVLGTATSSVTFSSLGDYSATYRHLQIRYVARTSRTETIDQLRLRINGNTSSSYASHRLISNPSGGNVQSSAFINETSIDLSLITGNTATSNVFSSGVVDLLDAYSSSKNKTTRTLAGTNGADFHRVMLFSGLFNNTGSVTSLQLLPLTGPNFVIGSRFSLYGIKG